MAATAPLRRQSSSSSVFTHVSVISSVTDGAGEAQRMAAFKKQLGSMFLGYTHAQGKPSPQPLLPPKKRSNMEGNGSYVGAASALNAFFGNRQAKNTGVASPVPNVRVPSPALETHVDALRIPTPPPMPPPWVPASIVAIGRRTAPPPAKPAILASSLVFVPVTSHETHLLSGNQVTVGTRAMLPPSLHSPVQTSEVVPMAELHHAAARNPLVFSTRLLVAATPAKPPGQWSPQGMAYNRTMYVLAAAGTTLAVAGAMCLFAQPHVAIAILIAAAAVGGLAALFFAVKGLNHGCCHFIAWVNKDEERPVWYWKHTPRRIVVAHESDA